MHRKEIHRKLAEKAIRKLRKLPEAEKLILYGSVARGDYRPNSDIDIAFICDDFLRVFFLDFEGFPAGLSERIDRELKELKERSGIMFHVPIYWSSELENGIKLFSGKGPPLDYLNKFGLVVYDNSKRYIPFVFPRASSMPILPNANFTVNAYFTANAFVSYLK